MSNILFILFTGVAIIFGNAGKFNSYENFSSECQFLVQKPMQKWHGTGSLASPIQATWLPGIDTIVNFHNVHSYLACCGGQFRNSSTPYIIDFSVDCGAGFDLAHKGGDPKIQSVTDNSQTECDSLYNLGYGLKSDANYAEENKVFRQYIEHCAQQDGSFHQFSALDGAMQFISDDNDRWLEYRDWLKKVLYLSMDTLYYCADANSILETFQYLRPGQGVDWNGAIAVIDYLLQNNRCPDSKTYLLKIRNRNKQIENWRDTVKDSTKTPLDTSAVTLESLGLEILRGQPSSVSATPFGHNGNAILSFIATKNPFNDGTVLRYELSNGTALRLEIYDILGREIYSEGEGMQEPGRHDIQLEGSRFSSGTYYARLSTVSGEVQTITLKHF